MFTSLLLLCSSAAFAQFTPGDDLRTLVNIVDGGWAVGQLDDAGVDVWDEAGSGLVARIRPDHVFLLDTLGLSYSVLIEDVYEWAAQAMAGGASPQEGPSPPWTTYHNLTSADAFMAELAAANADICGLETIGQSVEGRNIYAVRISDAAAVVDPSEPAIYVNGCHHAREWIAVEMPLYVADQLIERYRAGDVQARRLVNYTELWITAIVNPDGFLYSELTDRFWRKSRRPNENGSFGVDNNRNYSYQWGGPGSSGNPNSQNYRGPNAFSEPENQAVRDMIEGGFGRTFTTALDYHSYGQLVMHPWGYTTLEAPDAAALANLTSEMAAIIVDQNEGSAIYEPGQIGQILYLASGVSTDWFYGEHGMNAVIVELRPDTQDPGFLLPESEILATCQENFPAALLLAERTLLPPIGDPDADGVVGLDDYAQMIPCLTGPTAAAPPASCAAFDADGDNSVNLLDFAAFALLFPSPGG